MAEPTLRGSVGPLTRTDFVRYAGAGGDFNPIHHDEEFARAAGYPSVFGHGLLTSALALNVLVEHIDADRLRRFGVRYVDQVFPGDTLDVEWRRGDVGAKTGDVEWDLAVHAGADDRRCVLRGRAVVRQVDAR